MIVYTSKREILQLAESPFASGGEGAIYKVVSSPAHLQDVCVKLYHPHILDKEREDRVKYMVENPPEKIRDEGFLLGWPMEYVTDDAGRFLGFVMPLGFPSSKELVTLTATTLSKSLGQEWQERYDRSLGKTALLSRLKLMCNIAIPVHILHSTGKYVLKDFKPQNVLATADGRITICDMDSIQIAEGGRLLFPGTAATAEYIPPECYTKGVGRQATDVIEPSWDSFAIGTVFYQLLFGIHPYVVTPKVEQGGGSNDISHNISSGLFPFGLHGDNVKVRPKLHDKFLVLPEPLQDLFMRTFSEDAENRPAAGEWGKYIHDVVMRSNDNDREVHIGGDKGDDGNKEGKQPPKNKNKSLWWLLGCAGVLVLSLILAHSIDNPGKQEAAPAIEEEVALDAAESESESAESLYRKAMNDTLYVADDLIRAAEMGYVPAQTELGIRYYNGEDFTQDESEALRWFEAASEQGDSEAQDYITYMKGDYIVDGIRYDEEDPSEEDISDWKDEYHDICADKIDVSDEDYTISAKMLEKDPCLVYLILNSKSMDDQIKDWFNLYGVMDEKQILQLYSILYREKYKLAKIEMIYELKQKRINRKRAVLEDRIEELIH